MPIEKYNRYFGGKEGSASKARAAMQEQYGEKADRVFYATINKKKSAGSDSPKRYRRRNERG